MATRSKVTRSCKQEKRRRLHDAVDRMLNGPNGGDEDRWACQVLVDLGLLFQAAEPALDYEVGRVISGVDRRHGDFPSNLSWQNAELSVTPEQAKAWKEAGAAARAERPSSE
jgi:hypothetical protein